jgi:glyoxylase-like metal-dependent hydrolase (beta-lactamase superfamily II)
MLVHVGAVLLTAVLPFQPTAAPQDSLTARAMGPGVWIVPGPPGGTVLAVQGSGAALLVDAQSAEAAPAVARALSAVQLAPVTTLVHTHYHEDHIAGTSLLGQGGDVIAHVQVPVLAAVDTTIEELGWHREPAAGDDLPTVLVSSDTVVDVGGRAVELLVFPRAHSAGDLGVRVPDLNLIHTGDIVEMDAFPFVDWWAGGTLDGTVEAVERLVALGDAATRYVPGHGRVVGRDDLVAYREMLVEVAAAVRQAIADGLMVQETMDLGLAASWDADRGGTRAGRRFVGILYLGLAADR